jgi:hypothetical protein
VELSRLHRPDAADDTDAGLDALEQAIIGKAMIILLYSQIAA